MRLGGRLSKIAAFVPQGARVADIGADHAYLPIWLCKNGVVDFAVTTDIAEGPCRAAAKSIAAAGFAGKIEARQGDGLSALNPGEVDAVIIAGLGGAAIINILAKPPGSLAKIDSLVLQPMAGSRALRAWLYACGWPPVKEELAVDGKKLYEIIFAQKNPEKERAVYSDFQLEAGPVLLKTGHRYLKRHVGAIAARYERICQSLGNSRAPGIAAKRLAARAILEEAEGCLLCL